MLNLLTSLSVFLFLTLHSSVTLAANGVQTSTHSAFSDAQAYDELTASLLVSLLIVGIYAFYWLKQKA